MIPTILRLSQRNLAYAQMHLEDIDDSKMCVQPAGLVNHPAWIVGHIAAALDLVLRNLGRAPAIPAAWGKLFGWGSIPISDRTAYPAKSELMAALTGQHQRVADALAATSPEALDRPVDDEDLRKFMPTVGGLVSSILTNHEAIHLGQLSAWRVAMGLPLRM